MSACATSPQGVWTTNATPTYENTARQSHFNSPTYRWYGTTTSTSALSTPNATVNIRMGPAVSICSDDAIALMSAPMLIVFATTSSAIDTYRHQLGKCRRMLPASP